MTDPDLDGLKTAVGALLDREPHQVPDGQLMVSTEELFTLRACLDAAIAGQVQVIHTRDLTVGDCGLKTKNWMVTYQHLAVDDATSFLTVAKALPFRPHVAAALRAGEINLAHARRIVTSTKKVPAELQEIFEKELVTAAGDCDPTALGGFARELRGRLGADESREAAEERMYDDRWVQLDRTYDGMTSISGMLDPASAAVVEAALTPLMNTAGARTTARQDNAVRTP